MHVTLGDAARRTGLSKATISRAVKSGKLSAAEVNPDGSYKIDLAELARVYDLKPGDGFMQPSVQQNETPIETGGLQVEVAVLREKLSSALIERERDRETYSQQIQDLRTRLDAEAEERRKLTAILTDQTNPPPPPQAPAVSVIPQPATKGGFLSLFRRKAV